MTASEFVGSILVLFVGVFVGHGMGSESVSNPDPFQEYLVRYPTISDSYQLYLEHVRPYKPLNWYEEAFDHTKDCVGPVRHTIKFDEIDWYKANEIIVLRQTGPVEYEGKKVAGSYLPSATPPYIIIVANTREGSYYNTIHELYHLLARENDSFEFNERVDLCYDKWKLAGVAQLEEASGLKPEQ